MLCQFCALMKSSPPAIDPLLKFSFHEHPLEFKPNAHTGWECDGPGECILGIQGYRQKCYLGLRCDDCDFDICMGCVLENKD